MHEFAHNAEYGARAACTCTVASLHLYPLAAGTELLPVKGRPNQAGLLAVQQAAACPTTKLPASW